MNRIIFAAGFSALILLFQNPAMSQEKPGGWNIDVTPRFWYMMVNPTPFSESSFLQQTNETAMFPLYGISLRVEPPGFSGSDFLLTGFRGSDSVDGRSVNALGVSARHRTDATRTDIELLYRTRVPNSNIYWFVGGRWVLFEEESDIGSGLVFPASGTSHLSEETNFYFGELGASFSTPIDRRGRHVLFGNFTGGVGYESQEVTNRGSSASPDHEGFIPFIDVNLGYQYIINKNANFHARYRTFVMHEVVREEIMALHGPEVGLTVRF